MKKTITSLFALTILAGLLSGCGESAEQKAAWLGRQSKYKKIAIVCAPKGDASPEYTQKIIDQIKPMIPSRLGFLEKVECINNASVDFSSATPVVSFPGKQGYDGVVCAAYSYGDGHVIMDLMMLDGKTGQSVWTHQFDSKDSDLSDRLGKHGYYVPTVLKGYFYGYGQ